MSANKTGITLCLIVKNEEAVLERCLKSFQGLWDELIITDTGSTDRTKEIAKSFNAQLHDFEWIDDFSAARNFCISKVQTPWTMMIDADDVIEEADREELLRRFPLKPNFLYFLPYYYSGTRTNPNIIVPTVRIWPTDKNYRYERTIHEQLNFRNESIKQHLNIPILHQKTTQESINAIHRNIRILSRDFQLNPHDQLTIYYLARELKNCGQFLASIKLFNNYLQLSPSLQNTEILQEVVVELSQIYLTSGAIKEAYLLLNKYYLLFPFNIKIEIILAELEMHHFSTDKAIQILKNIDSQKNQNPFAIGQDMRYTKIVKQLLEEAIKNKLSK